MLQRECEPLLFSSRHFIVKTAATPRLRSLNSRANASYENNTLVKYSSFHTALSRLTLMPFGHVCSRVVLAQFTPTCTWQQNEDNRSGEGVENTMSIL
jgi:hypothetical protein